MTGNTGNTGNAGLSGDAGGGWFLPDRVDLPFVTELDPASNPISNQRRTQLAQFPRRSWSARWNAWLVLDEFADQAWKPPAKLALNAVLAAKKPDAQEIDDLVLAAQNERADAMGEILSQDVEFISDFMGLLTITPGSHPKTYRVLHIASLIGSFIALHFKGSTVDGYERVRPSQLCPALLPPVPVPGHASFPSGHSTQAHLMAGCIGYLLDQAALPQPDRDALTIDLGVLADRVARNREIAGLHYESDSKGGAALAASVLATLTNNNAAVPAGVVAMFDDAITEAIGEWP